MHASGTVSVSLEVRSTKSLRLHRLRRQIYSTSKTCRRTKIAHQTAGIFRRALDDALSSLMKHSFFPSSIVGVVCALGLPCFVRPRVIIGAGMMCVPCRRQVPSRIPNNMPGFQQCCMEMWRVHTVPNCFPSDVARGKRGYQEVQRVGCKSWCKYTY